MPYIYPETPEQSSCAMLLVPMELVPIIGAHLSQLEKRQRWVSDDDWIKGYRAVVDLQDQLMSNCIDSLIAEIRALRGIRPDFVSVPEEERTIDMYHDITDLIVHLNTIIFALSGGAELDDSIIVALRGIVPADETRNIVELLS